MSLLVTGTIGIDTVHTPTGAAERIIGGSASYFAAAASLLMPQESRVRLVAAVGGDWPEDHREALSSFPGICLKGLERRAESRTFAWGGRYHENMNDRETLFTELGVLEEPPPAVPEEYRDSKFIFLANTHPEVQGELLDHFPDRSLAVADTMNLWINIAHDELLALLRRIDGLVLNDEEAELLTETRNPVSAARRIIEMGPKFVVVKKGEHGSVLIHEDGIATLPAYPASADQVVDPTGAGDSFAGGMMAHLASQNRTDFNAIRNSLAWGTVAASFTIESFGLQRLRSATREDLKQRYDRFRRAISID